MTFLPHASMARRLLRALLTVLTLLSLDVGFLTTGASAGPLVESAAVWALGAGALWLLYGAWLRQQAPFSHIRFWVLAALFAAVVTLGQSFAASGTAELVTARPAKALLMFLGRVPLYDAAMRLLLHALTERKEARAAGNHSHAAATDAASSPASADNHPHATATNTPPCPASADNHPHAAATNTAPCPVAAGGHPQATAADAAPCVPAPSVPQRASPLPRLLQAHPSLVFFAALLLCWLPYYICTFPGTVSNDSVTQLKELLGIVPLSNGNPIFQTGLIGAFVALGAVLGGPNAAVALYCCVQALLLAWLLGSLLAWMQKSPAPRWLVWGALGFYALCPVFPLFAFCVGKDTNFAMAVLFLSLCARRVTDARAGERPCAGLVFSLSLAAALCALLRNPGAYLALLTLLLLLCWTLAKRRRPGGLWRVPAVALAVLAGVYAALHLLVIPALNAQPMPETEHLSLPLQQVARVASSEALTPEEAAVVDGAMVLSELKAAYNGELSDPVKLLWREDATAQQKADFWRVWRSFLRKYPKTCLSATFHNTYGYLYPGYRSALKPTLLIGDQSTRTANLKGVYDYSVNPRSENLKALTDRMSQNPLYRAVISPGLYGWLTLFAAAALWRRGKRRMLLPAVPALFTLGGCLLSAVNAYFRYAMPLYLCAPLLLWLCAQPVQKGGDEP